MTISAEEPIADRAAGPAILILASISLSHFLNDTIQSMLTAIYPILKESFQLNFSQIGLITFVFQVTASIFQPFVGYYTDIKPKPYALTFGMGSSLVGLLLLSVAPTYGVLLIAAGLIGFGSAIFHPDSSRVARMASGGRHGMAQAVFQVGGSLGSALGPVLAALIIVPNGQGSVAWFSGVALLAMVLLWHVGRWLRVRRSAPRRAEDHAIAMPFSSRRTSALLVLLATLIFSKNFYIAAFTNYYTFYLIEKFGLSVSSAQFMLFLFLAGLAIGTLAGGALGDRFGRKYVILGSIFGVLPFSLALPYAGLAGTIVLTVLISLILASAFSAIVVYGQELLPGRIGAISGLFFGLAFGMGGLGAALLGVLADHTSLDFVFRLCGYLPAIGAIALLLPDIDGRRRMRA